MGTPFINFLGPSVLNEYDRKKGPTEQPSHIPPTFLDAMEVREEVFVKEQGVPLENEFDSDDARACHWVKGKVLGLKGHGILLTRAGHLCFDQYCDGA
jgi:hypothetical protein